MTAMDWRSSGARRLSNASWCQRAVVEGRIAPPRSWLQGRGSGRAGRCGHRGQLRSLGEVDGGFRQAVKQFGLMDTKSPGVSHAMVGQPGDIQQWIQFVKTPGAMLTNPAMLAGGAGIMAQMAMQQHDGRDHRLSRHHRREARRRAPRPDEPGVGALDGVDLAIRRPSRPRVRGPGLRVTWSKVQNSAQTIHETQGYALRQLGDLAEKIEEKTKLDDLAEAAKEAEAEVQKWLAVLARCFQLHDAVAVLELDRVLDASPDELDRHRIGLKAARQDRLELISESTERLLCA